eukprot:gene11178-biopygen2300
MNADDLLSFLQWLIRHEPRLNSVDQWSSGKPEDGAWRLVALGKVWSDKDSQPSIDDAGLPPSTAPPPPSTPKRPPLAPQPGTVARKAPPPPPAAAAAGSMPPPPPRGEKQPKPKSKNGPTPPPKRRQKDDDTMDEDAFDRAQAERARADAATQERIAEEQRLVAIQQQTLIDEQRALQARKDAEIAEQQKRYAQLSQQLNAMTQQALAPLDQDKFNREKPQRDAIRNEIIKIKQWLAATTGDILPSPQYSPQMPPPQQQAFPAQPVPPPQMVAGAPGGQPPPGGGGGDVEMQEQPPTQPPADGGRERDKDRGKKKDAPSGGAPPPPPPPPPPDGGGDGGDGKPPPSPKDKKPSPKASKRGEAPGHQLFQQIYGVKISRAEYQSTILPNLRKQYLFATKAMGEERELNPTKRSDFIWLRIAFPDFRDKPTRDNMTEGLPRELSKFIDSVDYESLYRYLDVDSKDESYFVDQLIPKIKKLWDIIVMLVHHPKQMPGEGKRYDERLGWAVGEFNKWLEGKKATPNGLIEWLAEKSGDVGLDELLNKSVDDIRRQLIEDGTLVEPQEDPATQAAPAADPPDGADVPALAPVPEPEPVQNGLLTAAKFSEYSTFIDNNYNKYKSALRSQANYDIFDRASDLGARMKAAQRAALVDGTDPQRKFQQHLRRLIVT